MVRIAIVEDDRASAQQIEQHIRRYETESGRSFQISRFTDGLELAENYRPVFDIIFLDIQMPGLDGMAAAERVRSVDADVILVFITNMAQYAIRGYAVNAQDFLLKPVPYFAFQQELRRSLEKLDRRAASYLLLPVEGGVRRIDVAHISYIESLKHRITVHTDEGDYSLSGTMKELEGRLADKNFFRCNSGYLVNLARVTGVRDGCALVGQAALPISRPKKKAFMDALTDYVGGVAK